MIIFVTVRERVSNERKCGTLSVGRIQEKGIWLPKMESIIRKQTLKQKYYFRQAGGEYTDFLIKSVST